MQALLSGVGDVASYSGFMALQTSPGAFRRAGVSAIAVQLALGFDKLMWPFKRDKIQAYEPPPRSPEAPAALQALGKAPGPSPWYLNGLNVSSGHGSLQWRSAGDAAPFAGKSLLTTTAGVTVAISDFHCYVRPVPGNQMFVWYAAASSERSSLRLELFDVDHLLPIGDVHAALTLLGPSKRIVTSVEPSAFLEFSTSLSDGSHTLSVPESLRGLGELLLLAPSTADGRHEDHFGTMHQRLWILNTSTGALTVVPQDWFNHGPYDFGYQWITRMARLPGSGDIVGEGIRLGVFRLDAAHRQIHEWLVIDTFYHPEREWFESTFPEA